MKPRTARTQEASRPPNLSVICIRLSVLLLCGRLTLLCYYYTVRLFAFIRCRLTRLDMVPWYATHLRTRRWSSSIYSPPPLVKNKQDLQHHKLHFSSVNLSFHNLNSYFNVPEIFSSLYHNATQIHYYDCGHGLHRPYYCSSYFESGNYTGKFGWSGFLQRCTMRWFRWDPLHAPVHYLHYSWWLRRLLWILSINVGHCPSVEMMWRGRLSSGGEILSYRLSLYFG